MKKLGCLLIVLTALGIALVAAIAIRANRRHVREIAPQPGKAYTIRWSDGLNTHFYRVGSFKTLPQGTLIFCDRNGKTVWLSGSYCIEEE